MAAYELKYLIRLMNDALDYAEVDPVGIVRARQLLNNELMPAVELRVSEVRARLLEEVGSGQNSADWRGNGRIYLAGRVDEGDGLRQADAAHRSGG